MRELDDLLRQRHSSRAPFDPARRPSDDDLRRIFEAARWAPTAHNMQNFEIVLVDDPKLLASIGELRVSPSEAFIRENYEQLSFSEDELARKKVGLLGAMFPESWRAPGGLDLARAMKEPPTHLRDTLRGAPTLLLVLYDGRKRAPASEGDALGLMSLGCMMENMWLVAGSLGIGFQVISTLASEPIATRVKGLLDVPTPMRIAFGVRLGYVAPGAPAHLRVRRDVQDFTHRNAYGRRTLR